MDKSDWYQKEKWLTLSELKGFEPPYIPESTLRVNCDTTNFSLNLGFDPVELGENRKISYLILHPEKISIDFCILREDIIPWLKQLEEWSGGVGNYRRFDIIEPTIPLSPWELKYIRFLKHPAIDNTFIVCSNKLHAFRWRNIKENSIDKKHLFFVKSLQELEQQIREQNDKK